MLQLFDHERWLESQPVNNVSFSKTDDTSSNIEKNNLKENFYNRAKCISMIFFFGGSDELVYINPNA